MTLFHHSLSDLRELLRCFGDSLGFHRDRWLLAVLVCTTCIACDRQILVQRLLTLEGILVFACTALGCEGFCDALRRLVTLVVHSLLAVIHVIVENFNQALVLDFL